MLAIPRPRAAILALGLFAPGPAHPGPPIWVDVAVGEREVVFHFHAEPEPLQEHFGLTGVPLGPFEPEEESRLRGEIERALLTRNPVTVNGAPVTPKLRELVLPVDSADADGWLQVEAFLVYACDDAPRRISVSWTGFEGAEWMGERYVPILFEHGRDMHLASLSPEEPGYTWHSREHARGGATRAVPALVVEPERSIPVLSLALFAAALAAAELGRRRRVPVAVAAALFIAGSGAGGFLWRRARLSIGGPGVPAAEQALALFEALHGNVYAAFDAGSEDEIYELLAKSVDATLLDELYGDVYESLILREEGGAVCSIEEVEVLECAVDFGEEERAPERRFDVDWTWRVRGLVAHWGHIHRRTNQYRATYTVRHDGRSWKISGVKVHEHSRTGGDER